MNKQAGFISGAVIGNIVLGIVSLLFGSIMIWALVNYNDQKNNVEAKIDVAEKQAKTEQIKEDQKEFDEKQKDPMKEFVGPVDLGRVTFTYPKTWSVYVASDGINSANYEAYLHPEIVQSVTNSQNKFALRVSIVNQNYDQVLQQYSGSVKSGALSSQAVTANGFTGTRFDGKFTEQVEGSAAIFKIRDKTLILRTDSPSFRPDFNDRILAKLSFSQ